MNLKKLPILMPELRVLEPNLSGLMLPDTQKD
jgi:hypothetical protein